ncbi:MAG: thiamine-monophosphate kinase [Opitutales bacterium]
MPSPFATDCADTFAQRGEAYLLDSLDRWLGQDARLLEPFARRDDAAVLALDVPPDFKVVKAADSLVFGIHFETTASPEQAAHKLLRRNLSDFAAMGAWPTSALLTLFLAPNVSVRWLEGFFTALGRDARRFDVTIAGGDVSSATEGTFAASLFLSGHAEKPIARGRSQPGETLWVTGELGGSLRGRHLDFEPRLEEGRWLAQRSEVTSMIDLSDGLASDLPKLLGAGRAARIDAARLPMSADAHALSKQSDRSALDHACCDGEDYELAFTLAVDASTEVFSTAWKETLPTRLSRIGDVVPVGSDGACLLDAGGGPLPVGSGYQHGG